MSGQLPGLRWFATYANAQAAAFASPKTNAPPA